MKFMENQHIHVSDIHLSFDRKLTEKDITSSSFFFFQFFLKLFSTLVSALFNKYRIFPFFF